MRGGDGVRPVGLRWRRGRRGFHADPDFAADAFACAHPVANSDTDTNADADPDPHTVANSDPHTDTDTDTGPNPHTDADGNRN